MASSRRPTAAWIKVNKRVTNEVRYMTADEEEDYIITQANEPLDENHWFVRERVTARSREDTVEIDRNQIDYMDVTPPAAGLRGFGHDSRSWKTMTPTAR